ncbi:MAG: hypothetical protein HQL58_08405 [Magnetococcales bacterium]|nr:hypothetical protein [Magnetococcales bacterium]
MLSFQPIRDIFIATPELGESGETFLSDGQGLFITPGRYSSTQGVSHPIAAVPMQHFSSRNSVATTKKSAHSQQFLRDMGCELTRDEDSS